MSRARYNFLKGKLLNVVPKYSKDAESLLSKSIKLDPKLVDAWNELGECYWKNDELSKSINCFEGALKEVCMILFFSERIKINVIYRKRINIPYEVYPCYQGKRHPGIEKKG